MADITQGVYDGTGKLSPHGGQEESTSVLVGCLFLFSFLPSGVPTFGLSLLDVAIQVQGGSLSLDVFGNNPHSHQEVCFTKLLRVSSSPQVDSRWE